jgi:hypothetical protein
LTACIGTTLKLEFQLAYSIESSGGECADGLVVQIEHGDEVWNSVTPSPGYDDTLADPQHVNAGQMAFCGLERDWALHTVTLEDADMTAGFRLRFYLESDSGYPWSGPAIDNIAIVAQ